MDNNTITIGSLFSGIGGLELGLERALTNGGFVPRVAWQCEIEPYARRVLAKHWPNTKRYEDVRTIGKDETIEPVDIICGGFPCQDLSYAGKRAGLGGERSGLFWELMRIVRLVRPGYVILENVPGLLTADNGEAMGSVLGALAESGYDAEWDCIPAAAVGAPHRRDRIFILANSNQIGWENVPEFVSFTKKSRFEPWLYFKQGWPVRSEPGVVALVDGVPDRVDRLAGYGNAVVSQVAEVVGNRLVEIIREQS